MRHVRKSEGQAVVELVLVMPLILVMVFSIVEFGFALNSHLAVSNAAAEGTDTTECVRASQGTARYSANGRCASGSRRKRAVGRRLNGNSASDPLVVTMRCFAGRHPCSTGFSNCR